MNTPRHDFGPAMDAVADLELSIVSHRIFDTAIEEMEMLHARALHRHDGRRMRARGMLLLGDAGAGKTTVIQHFLDTHPPQKTEDGITLPAVVVEIPPAPTFRAVVDALYSALGYQAERALSAEDIVKDLKNKVDLLGVASMLLDESHHIIASRTSADVTEFLKSLLNRLGCNMVFSGLPELVNLRSSFQLGRRLFPDVQLRPYNFSNKAERLEFMSFLSFIEQKALSLPQPSKLGDQDLARRIYAASGGLLGIVTKYLSHALLLAQHRGLPRIDLALLAEVDARFQGASKAPDDIGFDEDLQIGIGVDIASMLAQAARTRIDADTNPFMCKSERLLPILQQRTAKQLVAPQKRRLDNRMKGAGADAPSAFK